MVRLCAPNDFKIGCLKLAGDDTSTSKYSYESVSYVVQLLLVVVDGWWLVVRFDVWAKKNRGPADRI